MLNSKPFWQSKTIWLQLGTLAVGSLTALAGAHVNPTVTLIATVVIAGLNTVVRSVTTQPISLTGN